MKRTISRVAIVGAFMAALAGCQLITGTYNAGGITSGTSCSAVALCCYSLTGSQATTCELYAQSADEATCAAFLLQGTCGVTTSHDGGVVDAGAKNDGTAPGTDGSTPGMDANGQDVLQSSDASPSIDVFQGSDAFVGSDSAPPFDAGQDTSMPVSLDGTTWTLSDVQCQGSSVGVDGSSSLTFSGTTVTETDSLSDGCVIQTTLSPATISATDIATSGGNVACGASCTTNDSCFAGDPGAVDEPYTLSGGTLTITQPDNTGTCSSGTLTYLWISG
jgi:hypothetical protein